MLRLVNVVRQHGNETITTTEDPLYKDSVR